MKKFLFSLPFLFFIGLFSFNFISSDSFCASVALDGASLGVQGIVSSGVNSMGSFGFDPVSMSIMATEAYDELDSYLYSTTGYDVEDYYNRGVEQQQKFTASIDNTPLIADAIANKMTNNLYNATALTAAGYQLISKQVQQFGANAKAWFFGKVDSATNTVNDAVGNLVTKVTAEGMTNYVNAFSHLSSNNHVDLRDTYGPIYSQSFKLYYPSSNFNTVSLNFNVPVVSFVYSSSNSGSTGLYFAIPASNVGSGDYAYLSGFDGFVVSNGTYENIQSIYLYFPLSFYVNNIEYKVGQMYINSKLLNINEPVGNIYYSYNSIGDFLNDFLVDNTLSHGVAYEYSSTTLSSIQSLLNQLVGKYVDTDTMDKITTIIREIPVEGVVEEGVTVPEAVVTPDQVRALEEAIADAVALSEDYASILEDETTSPTPDPSIPENPPIVPDWAVPSFIPDLMPTDMFDMFQPVFDIVGTQYSMFSVWVLIPAIIIFVLILYIIVSLF